MPELPEIEHLKRTLEPLLVGASVRRVSLRRPDVVRNIDQSGGGARIAERLLGGQRIRALRRHGKELAILSGAGRAVCIHLGMSGQLCHVAAGARPARQDHVHCVWHLGGRAEGRLLFRDPRRFGGLRVFSSEARLRTERWSRLGPDALAIDSATLRARLRRTRRALKAALMDQALLAGLGNIYADEALFAASMHPLQPAARLPPAASRRLASSIRLILRRAVAAGGSTLRDYRDGRGRPGSFALQHHVYGRGGHPCLRCNRRLETIRIAQRTTVFCTGCQVLLP